MSLHILQACLAFLLPSLASAAPLVNFEIKLPTRDTSDDANRKKLNPGMIAGISFAILLGMSILFTVIRAYVDSRIWRSSLKTSRPPTPRPVTATAPNAPRVVLVSNEVQVQEPLPAYKLEEPVKMTEEEIEYHSIIATRTQRPPSYSSTAETLNESTCTQASLEAEDFR